MFLVGSFRPIKLGENISNETAQAWWQTTFHKKLF